MKNISQINIIVAICNELAKQGNEQDPPIETEVSQRQMNVIIQSATAIVEAMSRDDKLSEPGMGLQNWLNGDDTGTSSLTMAGVMFKTGKYAGNPSRGSHPLDPADFGRCHRFLEAVPGAREKLAEMKSLSTVWAALVDQWDAITALFLEEWPLKKAHKCYALMQTIIKGAS